MTCSPCSSAHLKALQRRQQVARRENVPARPMQRMSTEHVAHHESRAIETGLRIMGKQMPGDAAEVSS